MLFEGNDLENSYAERRPQSEPRGGVREALDGTIVQPLLSLPGRLRDQSILRRIMSGGLRIDPVAAGPQGRLEIDGVRLTTPLFR